MNTRKIIIILISVILIFTNLMLVSSQEKNIIQMAILLDTSNSMDGLINQAKTQLWKIVNEMALAERNGESPVLEVALYEYGNDGLPAGEGFMRMVLPLTRDLDLVSEKLFELTTYGGSEYCGQVIKSSVSDLKWDKKNDVLKVIFIAGNEPFTQGNTDYSVWCKNAIKKGIIVNTIHCGDYQTGVDSKWKHGADLADGKYMNIDQDQEIVDVQAPQDDEIIRLNEELNMTYIYYGSEGESYKKRQSEQDSNALKMNKSSYVNRSITKSTKQYKNSSWDLVDAIKDGNVDLDEVKVNELPDEMKKMSKKEREEYIKEQQNKRNEIQDKINKLSEERRVFIEKKMKENAADNTLDNAILNAIRMQLKDKNYKFK